MKKILAGIIILSLVAIIITAFIKKQSMLSKNKKDDKGIALIELFTSEGCSSCPPADEAISEIQDQYKGKNVLTVGFHVDYWDRLGWKDPFSSHEYTARQEYYSSLFNLTSIYTPQAVINGKHEFVGSDKNKIINTVEEELKSKPTAIIKLKASENGSGKIEARYSTEGGISTHDQLILLLIQKTATTNVKRGENGGRVLHHINIVRQMSLVPIPLKEEILNFNLPSDLKKENTFIAAFIQDKKTGGITGLTTAEIN